MVDEKIGVSRPREDFIASRITSLAKVLSYTRERWLRHSRGENVLF